MKRPIKINFPVPLREKSRNCDGIVRHFYEAHIENCRGTHRENRDCIRKKGKYRDSEKAETNRPETFEESGGLPLESDWRAKRAEAILLCSFSLQRIAIVLCAGLEQIPIVLFFPLQMVDFFSETPPSADKRSLFAAQ